MYSSLSCLGRAGYKQLALSSADWVYWTGYSEKQTFRSYVVFQILKCYIFVILRWGFCTVLASHNLKSLSRSLLQGRVAYILFLKKLASLGTRRQKAGICFQEPYSGGCLTSFYICIKQTKGMSVWNKFIYGFEWIFIVLFTSQEHFAQNQRFAVYLGDSHD